mmetsp:Transcript_59292/g.66370  ORF Transcript_59292/g.66370 Transcript_59292/m.66370 type:complete len:683 (-) Transcript_59292:60-2108(-)
MKCNQYIFPPVLSSRWRLIVPLLISVFMSIRLIIRSTLITGASRELLYSDHQFDAPSIKRQATSRNRTSQKETNISICFITSQFSSSRDRTDHLFDVRKVSPLLYKSPHYHFFAFSNLADLNAPGWEIIVKDFRQYKRWITASRWPKFQSFLDTKVRDTCQVIFYIDGILSPKDNLKMFQTEARNIMNSTVQLAQRIHPHGGGAEAEFDRIILKKKDLKKNVKASLQWLQAQSDYNMNCTLYENSIIGYAIDSSSFKITANFFWDHYSKEEDSWRDQPLWCYSLNHFGITPLRLTGNGKGTLFDQVDSRTAKGSHKYKSESIVSAANFYESFDAEKLPKVKPCWLDENTTVLDKYLKPIELFQPKMSNGTILSAPVYNLLRPICPDLFRRTMAPEIRTHPGITISIPYFAQPALLLQQLNNFASYPKVIQKQLSVIIVDDGSPLGLRATDYLNITASENNSLYYLNNNSSSSPIPYFFILRIVRIDNEIDWNVEGSHNLAFYLAKTRLGLILDLRMKVPIETFRDVLTWNTTKINSETSQKQYVAHKFNQIRSDGKDDYQQSCTLIDVQGYWNSGGMDEDFAGSYGYGTYPHFWFLWEKSGMQIEKHNATFLLELKTDICDSTWLYSAEKIEQCNTVRHTMKSLTKEGGINRKLWHKKRRGKIQRSNAYLRFNWTTDFLYHI